MILHYDKADRNIKFKLMMGAFIFILSVFGMIMINGNDVSASSLKIAYSGKTIKYKNKQVNVHIDGKTINQNGMKGILIKGKEMVSYDDVIRKGLITSCTYSSKTKKIVIKKNNMTIKMTLGSKTAYVNGKKKKLSVAPVKVKYYKKNKTKVLIQLDFVAKNLGFEYSYSNGTVTMKSPLILKYDGKWTIYKSYKGGVTYNDLDFLLTDMPVLSLKGTRMAPAENLFGSVLGLNYQYDNANQTIKVNYNSNELILKQNSTTATLNGVAFALPAAPTVVKRNDTNKTVLMIPVSIVVDKLGFYNSWNKTSFRFSFYNKSFFKWSTENGSYDTTKYTNSITSVDAIYNVSTKEIEVSITGSNAETMQKLNFNNLGNQLEVYFPTTYNAINNQSASMIGRYLNSVSVQQQNDYSDKFVFTNQSSVLNFKYEISGNVIKFSFGSEWNGSYSLKLTKPSTVDFSTVTNTDLYSQNKFVITIPGNQVDFFARNPVINKNAIVTNLAVSLNAAGNTDITVSTSKLQGYKLYNQGSEIYIQTGDPQSIYKNIVVLDAGHGGSDPGAQRNGVNEKDLTYKMIYTDMFSYCNAATSDIKVYWTRTDDTYVNLYDRAAFASKVGADLFVSLHINASTSTSAKGTEVYYSTLNNSTMTSGLSSSNMADIFKNNLVNAMGTVSRGVKTQSYVVIKKNTIPAVLIELGFISNSSDFSIITNPMSQNKAANTIYNSLVEIFSKYPTGR